MGTLMAKIPNSRLRYRTRKQYDLIKRAARLAERGNLTEFVLVAAEHRAMAVISEHENQQAANREVQAVNH